MQNGNIAIPIRIDSIYKMRYFELPSTYTSNPGESHEAYEIILVEKGVFLDISEDPAIVMKAGDAVIYGQHYFHSTVCNGEISASVVILSFFSESEDLKRNLSGRHFLKLLPDQQKLIANILSMMPRIWNINSHACERLSDASPYTEQMCLNYFEILLCQIVEQLDCSQKKSGGSVFMEDMSNTDPTVNKTIEILKNSIYGRIDFDGLCNDIGYSKSYIARVFKAKTGFTVMDYYINLKIGEAKRLLLETHMNIDTIASSLCFESPQYFSKVFKKRTGMTPKYFRNKIFKGSVVQRN